jgi:hypothetical protein
MTKSQISGPNLFGGDYNNNNNNNKIIMLGGTVNRKELISAR